MPQSTRMKTILSILCLLAISICASAQLQVDFGAAVISGSRSKDFIRVRPGSNGAMDTSFTKYTCEVNGGGLFVYPKYEYKQMGAHSITIGFPIMIGLVIQKR